MSCQDTEETRKQIVGHNSVYDTLRKSRRVVYRDDCVTPHTVAAGADTARPNGH